MKKQIYRKLKSVGSWATYLFGALLSRTCFASGEDVFLNTDDGTVEASAGQHSTLVHWIMLGGALLALLGIVSGKYSKISCFVLAVIFLKVAYAVIQAQFS